VPGRRWLRPLSIRTRLTLWYGALLLAILAGMGVLSYRVLAWSLVRDVDVSIRAVAEVIRATGQARTSFLINPAPEELREILGSRFLDTFFQLLDPEGEPGRRSLRLSGPLPLSADARRNAARGRETFETVVLPPEEHVRLVTLPVRRDGRPAGLVQVGMTLTAVDAALFRYLQILLALFPIGLALAVAGGAWIARRALAPVRAMARQAREITAENLTRRVPRRGAEDELDYLADTLNVVLARLEAAFAELRRFTADAAHELRTPLTALKGGLEVALRHPRSAEAYERTLRGSLDEVNWLIRLAEDLLLLSRATAGAGLARARVELEPLLLDGLDVGLRLADGTGVMVGAGAVERAAVLGDATALRRLLLILVENAVKYTPEGGLVELSLTRAGDEVCLAVRDTGIGIDRADAARVFEPFVRLDDARSRETGGAGLGLAIARSIAVAHGGRVTLDSAPKEGSVFTVHLPAA
jgi:heavy metal sensor kinase